MIETQVLIQEIQKQHQISLKPDDPVFVVVTLNDLLLSHYLEKFQAQLEEQNKLVASQGIERLNQASVMGSEMVNRSLESMCQTLDESISQFAQQVMVMIDLKNNQKAHELQKMSSILQLSVCFSVACCFFIFGIMFKTCFP